MACQPFQISYRTEELAFDPFERNVTNVNNALLIIDYIPMLTVALEGIETLEAITRKVIDDYKKRNSCI